MQWNQNKGFTIVEVIVAACIFSLLSLGVFSLFNMGSKMYLAGSWKYNKQKEAERFLTILKERIEQASNPSCLKKDGEELILHESKSGFFINSKKGVIPLNTLNSSDKLYLTEFTVAKMDTSEAASGTQGIVLNHCVYCKSQGDGLAKLYLYMNNIIDSEFKVVNDGTEQFPADLTSFGNLFNGSPSEYSLPNPPQTLVLSDISDIEIVSGHYASNTASNTASTGGTSDYSSPVFGLNIKMRCPNPKCKDTTLDLKLRARIDIKQKLIFTEF